MSIPKQEVVVLSRPRGFSVIRAVFSRIVFSKWLCPTKISFLVTQTLYSWILFLFPRQGEGIPRFPRDWSPLDGGESSFLPTPRRDESDEARPGATVHFQSANPAPSPYTVDFPCQEDIAGASIPMSCSRSIIKEWLGSSSPGLPRNLLHGKRFGRPIRAPLARRKSHPIFHKYCSELRIGRRKVFEGLGSSAGIFSCAAKAVGP